MKILVIPGLTLPQVSEGDIARMRTAAGPDAEVIVTDPKGAFAHAADTEVILGFVPPALYAAAPKLKWVHAIASGVDAFLYPAMRDGAVVLTSEKGLVGEHLADHAFGLLLMLTRQLHTAYRLGPESWNHRPAMRVQEIELTGLVLGCVGFGGTGRAMAKRAAAFGMSCQAIDPEPVPTSAEVRTIRPVGEFLDLLATSDVVAVCCPLTPMTRDLFDERAFAAMRRSAFLVNVTRGEVMKEAALVEALQSGQIRGAALDVAPREPLPADSPLWSMNNIVMSPHTAGASQFRAARNIDRFVTNLERLRTRQTLEGIIDKRKGY